MSDRPTIRKCMDGEARSLELTAAALRAEPFADVQEARHHRRNVISDAIGKLEAASRRMQQLLLIIALEEARPA